jgi:methylated-DNA-protein-cysteine methyltransferase-like protein
MKFSQFDAKLCLHIVVSCINKFWERSGIMLSEFHQRVVDLIRKIPIGKVATYGQIAALAGNPRAARQIVRVLHTLSNVEKLPWHRVVNRHGRISLQPGSGYELQKAMLRDEGVQFSTDDRIDLDQYLWSPS